MAAFLVGICTQESKDITPNGLRPGNDVVKKEIRELTLGYSVTPSGDVLRAKGSTCEVVLKKNSLNGPSLSNASSGAFCTPVINSLRWTIAIWDITLCTGSRSSITTFMPGNRATIESITVLAQRAIGGGDVPRQQIPLWPKQVGVTVHISWFADTTARNFKKVAVPAVERPEASRGSSGIRSLQIRRIFRERLLEALVGKRRIEIVQFLDRRHPEFRMELQLIVEPSGRSFLKSHAQKVRAVRRPSRPEAW